MELPKGLKLFDMTSRVAVVTGASSGIGASLAGAFRDCGAEVVVVARREDRLQQVAKDLKAAYVVADMADHASFDAVADAVRAHYGPPDIVVNAAGNTRRAPAHEVTPEDWNAVMAVQLAAPLFFSQRFVGAMRDKGWGRIINIGSLSTGRALPNATIYGTAKTGIWGLTRQMAMDFAPWGVTVNALCPGYFETELTAPIVADKARWQALADTTMMGRNGDLEDLHGGAIFLASDAGRYVTGQLLYVDGGFTAK